MSLSDEDLAKIVEEAATASGTKGPARAQKEPELEFADGEAATEEGTKYSDLFGWDYDILDGKKDFTVETFEHDHDVPEADPHYVVNHEVMYPLVLAQQPKFKGMKVMLVGPTGSGKTTAVYHYCAKVGKSLYRINGRQDMESDTLIGRPWVGQDGMEYILGDLPRALLDGKHILIDEPWKIPPGIWMTLQRLMERGGVLQIDDMPEGLEAKTIVPHKDARITLADNVIGTGDNVEQYGATMIQDSSTLNRIDIVLQVPYMDSGLEQELLANKYPLLVPKNKEGDRGMHNVERMVTMLNLLRQGFDSGELRSPASLRNVEAWAEMAIELRDYAMAFKIVLLNRYASDAERGAVVNHYQTVFGRSL